MIDYNIRFFASSQTRKPGYEEHYASWLETMLAQFGHKWLCLHRGPVWQYEEGDKPEQVASKSLVQIALDECGINLEGQLQENSLVINETQHLQSLTDIDSNPELLDNVKSSLDNLTIFDCHNCERETELLQAEIQPTRMDKPLSHINEQSVEAECVDTSQSPSFSNIWSRLTKGEESEIETGLINPKVMERHHGTQPNPNRKVKRNSGLFDTLKES